MTVFVSAVGCVPWLGGAAPGRDNAASAMPEAHLRYLINDIKLRRNLSPHTAAASPTAAARARPQGSGTPPHRAAPPARMTPKINLRRMVVAPITPTNAGRPTSCQCLYQ